MNLWQFRKRPYGQPFTFFIIFLNISIIPPSYSLELGTYHAGKCEYTDASGDPQEADCCGDYPAVDCPSGSSDGDSCTVVISGITYDGTYHDPVSAKESKFTVCAASSGGGKTTKGTIAPSKK